MMHPSLVDPEICGEDLVGNAQRVLELAPGLCSGCSDYHIRSVLHRTSGIPKGIAIDRPELVTVLLDVMRQRLSSGRRLAVFIAGAADTGILATCAHAAARLGQQALDRTDFTIADRCRTPLALCAEFAERHDLNVRIRPCDFLKDPIDSGIDVAVLHSVLRFLPRPDQIGLLSRIAGQLRPGGCIIVSQRLISAGYVEQEHSKREEADHAVLALLRDHRIVTDIPTAHLEELLRRSRIDTDLRPGEMPDYTEFQTVVTSAGLSILNAEQIHRNIHVRTGKEFATHRVLAVLGPREP